ncbi:MAG: IPT/TIG domain-containing protein, partial [Planctomycetota bacterium]
MYRRILVLGVLCLALASAKVSAQQILRVDPEEVSSEGGALLEVHGRGFVAGQSARLGGEPLLRQSLTAGLITGTTPALPAGTYDVEIVSGRGVVVAQLARAVRVVDQAPPPPKIVSVEPSEISSRSGGEITVRGENFEAAMGLAIQGPSDRNSVELSGVRFVSQREIRALAPAHPAEAVTIYLLARRGVPIVTAKNAFTYVDPSSRSRVTAIVPRQVPTSGGVTVQIRGSNFTRDTEVFFDPRGRGKPVELDEIEFRSRGLLVATVPALQAGWVDLIVRDASSRGETRVEDAVQYVAQLRRALRPPEQFETTQAEGIARFIWHNPADYDEIEVFDAEGSIVATLLGDATWWEVATEDRKAATYRFVGKSGQYESQAVVAAVSFLDCPVPEPLTFTGGEGKAVFYLKGGYPAQSVDRCEVTGARRYIEDFRGLDTVYRQTSKFTLGMVDTAFDQANLAKLVNPLKQKNQATTGFILDEDAEKLEIAVWCEKLASDFGMELRGRIIQMYPDDGFVDEFTFPEIRKLEGNDWLCATYFRADRDIRDPDAQSCGQPIPAGRYLLDLYVVGGDPKLPYFAIPADAREDELLIEGASCPPYPRVRVRDFTGIRSVPDVSLITANPGPNPPGNSFLPTFTAHGSWIDGFGDLHSLNPTNDSYVPYPFFEFTWIVHSQVPPQVAVVQGSREASIPVPDYGCYEIDLIIRDLRGGSEKKRQFEVPIYPAGLSYPHPHLSFLYPTPDPGGVFALTGLEPPPGNGEFQGTRPVDFRVLVAPDCCEDVLCRGFDLLACPSPQIQLNGNQVCRVIDPQNPLPGDDFAFRLAVIKEGPTGAAYEDLGARIQVCDLCPNLDEGPKYFQISIEDLGEVARHPLLEGPNFRAVFLQAKTLYARHPDGSRHAVQSHWVNVGTSLGLANCPAALQQCFWSGHFEEGDASYHFVLKSSQLTEDSFEIGPSKEIDLIAGAKLESKPNDLSSGFTSRIMAVGGAWCPETAPGTMSGSVLGNDMSGAPLNVLGEEVNLSGSPPRYEWCESKEVFS